jgi:hypothetical protein
MCCRGCGSPGARSVCGTARTAKDRGIGRECRRVQARGTVQVCSRASDREIGRVRALGIGPRCHQVQDRGTGRRDPPVRDRGNGRAGSRVWADRAAIGRRPGLAAEEGARARAAAASARRCGRRSIQTELPRRWAWPWRRRRRSRRWPASVIVRSIICSVVSGLRQSATRTGDAWCSNRLNSFA